MNKVTISLIQDWDSAKGFWKANPQMKVNFKDVYSKDRSKGKHDSSRLMWFCAFYIDPSSTMLDIPDKETIIGNNLWGKPAFYTDNEDAILAIIEQWKEKTWSYAKHAMERWRVRLTKRDDFLDDQVYFFDYYSEDGKLIKGNATDLDGMNAKTPKLWSDFFKILEELEQEGLEGESFGGAEDSFLDDASNL
jgi:hypothetical protein